VVLCLWHGAAYHQPGFAEPLAAWVVPCHLYSDPAFPSIKRYKFKEGGVFIKFLFTEDFPHLTAFLLSYLDNVKADGPS